MNPFERVALINLDRRPDRLGAFRAKIAAIPELHGFVRYRAVHGDTVGVPGFYLAGGGAYGCRQSHLRVLEEALLDGIETVFVLEDDVCFCTSFSDRLHAFLQIVPPDWEGLMLGGQDQQPARDIGVGGVRRTHDTHRTHAYAVRGRDALRDLYRLWSRCDNHIDKWIHSWQQRRLVYQPDPFLCGQDAGPSDISGKLDAVRFWSHALPAPSDESLRPIYLVHADKAEALRLRNLGLHWGHDLHVNTGFDAGLVTICAKGWPLAELRDWIELIVGEANESGGVPALWHQPAPALALVKHAVSRPVVEVRATGGEPPIPELLGDWRRAQILWVWRGTDREVLEGLRYHGFHTGWWRDEVTGLDNGLRRVVEGNQWSLFASVLRDLTREASGIRKGKVLLAHPAIDVTRVRDAARRTVVELVGDNIGELLAQALAQSQEATL